MSDTPEIDAKWESECCSGKSWYRIAEEMKFFAINREIERRESQKENKILKQQLEDTREVLSEISLNLSVGMGDESTTAKQYRERILEGIKMLTKPIVEDWKNIRKEKDIFLEALMQIEEVFIDGEDTYDSWKKMGDISRNALKDVKF